MKRVFHKCTKCGFICMTKHIEKNYYICNACNKHEQLHYDNRIKYLVDKDSFIEINSDMSFADPIQFPGYKEKYNVALEKTRVLEAIITGTANIDGEKVMLGVMDSRFMMGSMGIVVGEKITRLFEEACKDSTPVIIFSASGGARMQEGIFSLMQMAKTTAALAKHNDTGGLFISVLTHPTTGGVSASYALLGDVNLSEPRTLIGFAGKRVIEQTINETLSEDFQTSEFLLEHGFLDAIIERKELRNTISHLLKLHKKELDYKSFNCLEYNNNRNIDASDFYIIQDKDKKDYYNTKETIKRSAWDKVLISRDMNRFRSQDVIHMIFDSFIEFHGDRFSGDDKSMICGISYFAGIPVTVISQQKGKDMAEMVYRHYGMTFPEGYRKSLRLMKQAEKFKRPIICFIDTPGAFPGVSAEEHGQAEAIGKSLFEMSYLKVPIISIVLSEGGSGGALAIGVANKFAMLENSIFSVVSPEGCSSILWKNSKLASKAAKDLKITAEDLYSFGIIDCIISERGSFAEICKRISGYIYLALAECSQITEKELIENRRKKYRNIDLRYI